MSYFALKNLKNKPKCQLSLNLCQWYIDVSWLYHDVMNVLDLYIYICVILGFSKFCQWSLQFSKSLNLCLSNHFKIFLCENDLYFYFSLSKSTAVPHL